MRFVHATYQIWGMALLSAILFWRCTNDIDKIIPVKDPQKPDIITQFVEVIYSDSGQVKFKLNAPVRHDFVTGDVRSEMLNGVTIQFFNPNLEVVSTLQADKAVFYSAQGLLYATGNVVVKHGNSETLETQTLVWNEKNQTLYSNDMVTITTPDKILYGEYFVADRNFSNYQIINLIGTLSVSESMEK